MNKLLLAVNQSDYNRDLEQIKSLTIALSVSFCLFRLVGFRKIQPYALSAAVFSIERLNNKKINMKYDESIKQMKLTEFESQVTNVMH